MLFFLSRRKNIYLHILMTIALRAPGTYAINTDRLGFISLHNRDKSLTLLTFIVFIYGLL
jgi:hypothetical protein